MEWCIAVVRVEGHMWRARLLATCDAARDCHWPTDPWELPFQEEVPELKAEGQGLGLPRLLAI